MTAKTLRAMVISAAMAAFGIALPIAFHLVGLGNKFLPMLLPLLLNGFLSPLPWAMLTGALVPLLSGLVTGMPPFFPPIALVMSLECMLMAGVAAGIYRLSRPRVWPALLAAIVADRTASFVLMWLLAGKFGLPTALFSISSFVQALPGVVLQLSVIPLTMRAISRRKIILFADGKESETTIF